MKFGVGIKMRPRHNRPATASLWGRLIFVVYIGSFLFYAYCRVAHTMDKHNSAFAYQVCPVKDLGSGDVAAAVSTSAARTAFTLGGHKGQPARQPPQSAKAANEQGKVQLCSKQSTVTSSGSAYLHATPSMWLPVVESTIFQSVQLCKSKVASFRVSLAAVLHQHTISIQHLGDTLRCILLPSCTLCTCSDQLSA